MEESENPVLTSLENEATLEEKAEPSEISMLPEGYAVENEEFNPEEEQAEPSELSPPAGYIIADDEEFNQEETLEAIRARLEQQEEKPPAQEEAEVTVVEEDPPAEAPIVSEVEEEVSPPETTEPSSTSLKITFEQPTLREKIEAIWAESRGEEMQVTEKEVPPGDEQAEPPEFSVPPEVYIVEEKDEEPSAEETVEAAKEEAPVSPAEETVEAAEEEAPVSPAEEMAEAAEEGSSIKEKVNTIWAEFRGEKTPVPLPEKEAAPKIRPAAADVIAPAAPGPVQLSLVNFVSLVREQNDRILYQQFEFRIASEAVRRERSIFEPEFVASIQREKNDVPNTTQESMSLGFKNEFIESNRHYNTGLSWLEPSGSRVGLEYRLSDLRNSLQNQVIDREWKEFTGVTISHPLLKNSGKQATTAKINIAQADRAIKFQAYRLEMMKIVAVASSVYYNLFQAQEKCKIQQESVRIAEQVLETNRQWVEAGRIPETEILESEAGLSMRKSLQSEAKQELTAAMNNLRSLLLISATSATGDTVTFVAADEITVESADLDFENSLQRAFKLRPEYLTSLEKTKQEDIRLAFARNQRRPQLDLKASYGFNGLDVDARDTAYDIYDVADNYVASTVGFEYRMPLGNRKTSSELNAARFRKEQALLELKAAEVQVVNSVDTEFQNVKSAEEQVRHYESAVDNKKQLLDIEFKRFNTGNSNSRLVLRRENDLNQTREEYLKSLVNYNKSTIKLALAEGTLLEKHDLEMVKP